MPVCSAELDAFPPAPSPWFAGTTRAAVPDLGGYWSADNGSGRARDTIRGDQLLGPDLELDRSLVDIRCRKTALLVSSTIGRRPGLLTLDDGMVRMIERLVADYGFRERLVGIDHLRPPLTELDLDKGFSGSAELVERFRVNARRLIAKGADVLIPAEGVLNILMVRNGLEEVDGVPGQPGLGRQGQWGCSLTRGKGRAARGRSGAYARPRRLDLSHNACLAGLGEMANEAMEEHQRAKPVCARTLSVSGKGYRGPG
jgi:hypothetical protein